MVLVCTFFLKKYQQCNARKNKTDDEGNKQLIFNYDTDTSDLELFETLGTVDIFYEDTVTDPLITSNFNVSGTNLNMFR